MNVYCYLAQQRIWILRHIRFLRAVTYNILWDLYLLLSSFSPTHCLDCLSSQRRHVTAASCSLSFILLSGFRRNDSETGMVPALSGAREVRAVMRSSSARESITAN